MAQVTGHGEHQVYVTINWPDQHITEIRRWNGLDDFGFHSTPLLQETLPVFKDQILDIRYSLSIWTITVQSFKKAH